MLRQPLSQGGKHPDIGWGGGYVCSKVVLNTVAAKKTPSPVTPNNLRYVSSFIKLSWLGYV
jgi:hypothetical protein